MVSICEGLVSRIFPITCVMSVLVKSLSSCSGGVGVVIINLTCAAVFCILYVLQVQVDAFVISTVRGKVHKGTLQQGDRPKTCLATPESPFFYAHIRL